jgi:small subunit ribosomal protein S15
MLQPAIHTRKSFCFAGFRSQRLQDLEKEDIRMALLAEERSQVVSTNRRHTKDTGSPEVQIGMLTAKINALSSHCQEHEKDNHSRRGLTMMVGQRNRLLRYLARTNPDGYQKLIVRLGLRK